MQRCRAVPRGLRAPAGTDRTQRAREGTQQQTKPQQPSALRLRVPRRDTARVRGCAGASGAGSPDTASPGSAEGAGTGEVNPLRGGGTSEHLLAPPRSPAREGTAGAAPASSAGAAPTGPPSGKPPETPPGSPSRLPARPQRAALTCGGWGRAAPAALRSAPAPPQLRCGGGLAPRAPPGGARRGGAWGGTAPGAGSFRCKQHVWAGRDMQIRPSRGSASLSAGALVNNSAARSLQPIRERHRAAQGARAPGTGRGGPGKGPERQLGKGRRGKVAGLQGPSSRLQPREGTTNFHSLAWENRQTYRKSKPSIETNPSLAAQPGSSQTVSCCREQRMDKEAVCM